MVSVQRDMKKPVIGKEYFKHMNLEAIVRSYPYRKNLPQEDIIRGYNLFFYV
jgi:dual specificity protein kinase YAK1